MRTLIIAVGVIASALLFQSCRNIQYEIVSLPPARPLTIVAEKIISEDCSGGVLLVDSLILTANRCGFGAFSVYRRRDLEHLFDFGVMGNKLSEFDSPFFYADLNNTDRLLRIYDINRLEEKEIDLEAILAGENVYASVDDIRLPQKIYWTRSQARAYNTIIGSDIDLGEEKGVFFIYDRDTQKKKYIDYFPEFSFRKERTYYFAYYNELFVNEKEGVVAVAYRHFNMVQFYNLDGEIIRTIAFDKIVKPLEHNNIAMIDYSYPTFNINCFGCEKYFFAVRFDFSMDDYNGNHNLKKETTTIVKFDWQGNLIESLSAPCDVTTLTCNAAGDTFYGVIQTEDPEYAKLIVMK